MFVSGCCMTRLLKDAWFLHSNAFSGGFPMSAALSSTDLTTFILITYVLHDEPARVLLLSTTLVGFSKYRKLSRIQKIIFLLFHVAVGYKVLRSEILLHIKLFGKWVVFEDKQLHLRGKEK